VRVAVCENGLHRVTVFVIDTTWLFDVDATIGENAPAAELAVLSETNLGGTVSGAGLDEWYFPQGLCQCSVEAFQGSGKMPPDGDDYPTVIVAADGPNNRLKVVHSGEASTPRTLLVAPLNDRPLLVTYCGGRRALFSSDGRTISEFSFRDGAIKEIRRLNFVHFSSSEFIAADSRGTLLFVAHNSDPVSPWYLGAWTPSGKFTKLSEISCDAYSDVFGLAIDEERGRIVVMVSGRMLVLSGHGFAVKSAKKR
jgi:hypothetical protein